MKIVTNDQRVRRFQEGGPMPAEGAPAPQGGQDQMMAQLEQMAMEILQQLGPDAAAMLAQMIMEMLQSAQQPEVGVAPEGEQQFMRRGGKIVKKACRGAKIRK